MARGQIKRFQTRFQTPALLRIRVATYKCRGSDGGRPRGPISTRITHVRAQALRPTAHACLRASRRGEAARGDGASAVTGEVAARAGRRTLARSLLRH